MASRIDDVRQLFSLSSFSQAVVFPAVVFGAVVFWRCLFVGRCDGRQPAVSSSSGMIPRSFTCGGIRMRRSAAILVGVLLAAGCGSRQEQVTVEIGRAHV